MKVFLGIYVVFGNSYLYTYYSLVGDSVQASEYINSFKFVFVSGSRFATPCLFMLVGFTHTFSW